MKFKMTIILIIASLCTCKMTYANPTPPIYLFQKSFDFSSNIDGGTDIIRSVDGNYLIVGNIDRTIFGAANAAFVLKFNAEGSVLWYRVFEGVGSARAILQNLSGETFVLGSTDAFGGLNPDILLMKLNSSGNRIWSKTLGGARFDFGVDMVFSNDGNIVLIGNVGSFGFSNQQDTEAYICKISQSGNIIWDRVFGVDSQGDFINTILKLPDGHFLISGTLSGNVLLSKVNSSGNEVWTKTYGEALSDHSQSIKIQDDGTILLVGGTDNNPFASSSNSLVTKLDQNGNVLRSRAINFLYDSDVADVFPTTDGALLLVSENSGTPDPSDLYLVKITDTGSVSWKKKFDFETIDQPSKMLVHGNAIFMLSNSTNSFGVNGKLVLAKTPATNISIPDEMCGQVVSPSSATALAPLDITNISPPAPNYPMTLTTGTINEGSITLTEGTYCTETVIVSTNDIIAKANNLTIFPNPSSSEINIRTQKTPVTHYELRNVQGHVVKAVTGMSAYEASIDIQTLHSGIYLLYLNGVFVRKVVKL